MAHVNDEWDEDEKSETWDDEEDAEEEAGEEDLSEEWSEEGVEEGEERPDEPKPAKKKVEKDVGPRRMLGKIVHIQGNIIPRQKAKSGEILELVVVDEIKTEYRILLNEMGKKLTSYCYHNKMVVGKLLEDPNDKKLVIDVNSFI